MFSPMVAIASEIAVSTVTSPTLAALIFSTSAPLCSATCAIILTRPWNCSLRATKSVSELTSTTTPLAPDVTAPIRPSAATRPAFLAAFDRPFLPSQSGPARKTNLFADLVRGIVVELGELPVVEDAEVVELLLDRTRHAGELLEVVGGAARPGQALEAGRLGSCRNFLAGRLNRGADVDAVVALGARDAVD